MTLSLIMQITLVSGLLWFIIALIVFIIKSFINEKIEDPIRKRLERKKAWIILFLPIVVLFVLYIIYIPLSSASDIYCSNPSHGACDF